MICCLVVRGVTLCWRPPCGFRSVGGCVCSRPRSCACCPPWPWLGRRVVAGGGVSFRRFPFFRAVAALCCRGGWFWVSTSEGQGLGCGTPGVRDVLRRVVFVVGSVSASRIFSHFSWASWSLCEHHLRERIHHRLVEFQSPLRGASDSWLHSFTFSCSAVAVQRLSFAGLVVGCPRSAYVEIGFVSTEPNI